MSKIKISVLKCVGCGKCIKVCPVDNLFVRAYVKQKDPDTCVGCGLCINECIFDAITLVDS